MRLAEIKSIVCRYALPSGYMADMVRDQGDFFVRMTVELPKGHRVSVHVPFIPRAVDERAIRSLVRDAVGAAAQAVFDHCSPSMVGFDALFVESPGECGVDAS